MHGVGLRLSSHIVDKAGEIQGEHAYEGDSLNHTQSHAVMTSVKRLKNNLKKIGELTKSVNFQRHFYTILC